MSNYAKLATETTDKYLAALAESQEAFLKSISTFTAWAPATPAVPMPAFVADLPTPQELTEVNFAFATKLLAQQKSFVEKLLATSPASTSAATKTEATKPAKSAAAKS